MFHFFIYHILLSAITRIGGVMASELALSLVDRWFIGGVMASELALSLVNRWFETHSDQTKVNKTGIWCFSAK